MSKDSEREVPPKRFLLKEDKNGLLVLQIDPKTGISSEIKTFTQREDGI